MYIEISDGIIIVACITAVIIHTVSKIAWHFISKMD